MANAVPGTNLSNFFEGKQVYYIVMIMFNIVGRDKIHILFRAVTDAGYGFDFRYETEIIHSRPQAPNDMIQKFCIIYGAVLYYYSSYYSGKGTRAHALQWIDYFAQFLDLLSEKDEINVFILYAKIMAAISRVEMPPHFNSLSNETFPIRFVKGPCEVDRLLRIHGAIEAGISESAKVPNVKKSVVFAGHIDDCRIRPSFWATMQEVQKRNKMKRTFDAGDLPRLVPDLDNAGKIMYNDNELYPSFIKASNFRGPVSKYIMIATFVNGVTADNLFEYSEAIRALEVFYDLIKQRPDTSKNDYIDGIIPEEKYDIISSYLVINRPILVFEEMTKIVEYMTQNRRNRNDIANYRASADVASLLDFAHKRKGMPVKLYDRSRKEVDKEVIVLIGYKDSFILVTPQELLYDSTTDTGEREESSDLLLAKRPLKMGLLWILQKIKAK